MKQLGTYRSKRWGPVVVLQGHYVSADGPLAVALELENGEPLATLSVNMHVPDGADHDSCALPAGCFYVKNYGGHEEIAAEALASGLFKLRDDLPPSCNGYVTVPAWQVVARG